MINDYYIGWLEIKVQKRHFFIFHCIKETIGRENNINND